MQVAGLKLKTTPVTKYNAAVKKNREKEWDHYDVTDRNWRTQLVRNVDSVCSMRDGCNIKSRSGLETRLGAYYSNFQSYKVKILTTSPSYKYLVAS